ncbi:MAG: response regulator [Nitrospirae bacterium]|nr:response regulator [Nitrospirota bacterium]
MENRTRFLLASSVLTLLLLVLWEFGIEPALSGGAAEPVAVRLRFVFVGVGAATLALIALLLLLARSDRRRAAAERDLKALCDTLEHKVRERTRDQERLTEQLRLEVDQHRQAAELFRDVTENIHEVFWVCAPADRRLLYVSPAFHAVWGREPAGTCPALCADAVHPDDAGRLPSLETRARQEVEACYRIIRPDGAVRWIRDRSTPVLRATGETARIVGVAEDITHLEELRERLLHSQRLQAVGTLAGGVAHDFNNLLGTIMASAETLQLGTPPDDPRAPILERINRSCRNGAAVVRNLLRFARRERLAPEPLHLPTVITETAHMARATFDRRCGLEVDVPDDLWPILGDATQIPQMLLNLLLNGRDAVLGEGGGTLRLTARNVPRSQAPFPDAEKSAERYVCIDIADDGCGMTDDVAAQAFNPFFTTKDGTRGAGLGLATAHGIVNAHGGHVDFDTRPGHGTTFHVWLPALAGAIPAPPAAAPEQPAARPAPATILVAEDEPDLLVLIGEHLTGRGHRVLSAADGIESLARLESDGPRIDLLILDLMLPGVTGWTVLERVAEKHPQLPVVVISGYAEDWEISKTAAMGKVAMLEKPFTLARFDAVVDRALTATRMPTAETRAPQG